MQAGVNAAPTAKEGARVRRCISALVSAGITGGYLASPPAEGSTLASRPPRTGAGGERRGRVRPVRRPLGDPRACRCGQAPGELAALTTAQVDTAARVVTVDR